MITKLILGVIFLYLTNTIKKDLYDSYESSIPILPKNLQEKFKNLQDPPNSVVMNGNPNYGIFNQPILNVNTKGLSILPFYSSDFLESLRLKKWEFHTITNDNWIFGFFVVNTG